jgi:SAM-dependent methyltransferase
VVTSILYEQIQPGGEILGIDYSRERINHARKHYAKGPGIQFELCDLTQPFDELGPFDLIWVRFFLEYFRKESPDIVRNLTACLKPGGSMCLLDLDLNCLNHYPLPEKMEDLLIRLIENLEKDYNFDPYSGRKLYSYLYDLGYQDIEVNLSAHHLFYGKMGDADFFNWLKKVEVASEKAKGLFEEYPGGREAFLRDFKDFFLDPRRFTYTPLIICKGSKSPSPL